MFRFLDQLTPGACRGDRRAAFRWRCWRPALPRCANFIICTTQPDGTPYANIGEMSERIAAAAATAGIGLTLLPVLYQHGGCDGRAARAGQIRFGNDPDRFRAGCCGGREGSLARPARATRPSGLRRIRCARSSPEGLRCCVALAAGVRSICMSPSRSPRSRRSWPPMARGRSNGCSTACRSMTRWCLIHCTQCRRDETARWRLTGRRGRPVPDHRIEPWRRHLRRQHLPGGTADLRCRVGFQHPHFACRGIADARIFAAPARPPRAALATDAVRPAGSFSKAAKAGRGRPAGTLARSRQGYGADLIGIDTNNQWLCQPEGDALTRQPDFRRRRAELHHRCVERGTAHGKGGQAYRNGTPSSRAT